jgi:hypothetical protein
VRWKEEGPLGTQLRVTPGEVWSLDIVVVTDLGIDRLTAELEDAPDTAADWYRPAIIAVGFPVCGDDGTGRQVQGRERR